jgi:hypothetical protein
MSGHLVLNAAAAARMTAFRRISACTPGLWTSVCWRCWWCAGELPSPRHAEKRTTRSSAPQGENRRRCRQRHSAISNAAAHLGPLEPPHACAADGVQSRPCFAHSPGPCPAAGNAAEHTPLLRVVVMQGIHAAVRSARMCLCRRKPQPPAAGQAELRGLAAAAAAAVDARGPQRRRRAADVQHSEQRHPVGSGWQRWRRHPGGEIGLSRRPFRRQQICMQQSDHRTAALGDAATPHLLGQPFYSVQRQPLNDHLAV